MSKILENNTSIGVFLNYVNHKKRTLIGPFFVTLTIFVSQYLLWRNADIADFGYWVEKMEDLRIHFQNLNFIFTNPPSHFGTLITLTGILFRIIGFNPDSSMRASIIAINSLIIVTLAAVGYRILPQKTWWVWIITPFIFNKYFASNPLDIAVSGLLCVVYLIVYYQGQKNNYLSAKILLLAGIILGLSAATRLHMTLLIGIPAIAYLIFSTGWKRLVVPICAGMAIFLVLTPYLWHSPSSVNKSIARVIPYYQNKTDNLATQEIYRLPLPNLLFQAPFATATFFIVIVSLLNTKYRGETKRSFLILLLLVTILAVMIILNSNIRLIRFLYPAIFMLEIFLFPAVEPYLHRFKNFPSVIKNRLFVNVGIFGIMQIFIVLTFLMTKSYFHFLPERYLLAMAEFEIFIFLCFLSINKNFRITKFNL